MVLKAPFQAGVAGGSGTRHGGGLFLTFFYLLVRVFGLRPTFFWGVFKVGRG